MLSRSQCKASRSHHGVVEVDGFVEALCGGEFSFAKAFNLSFFERQGALGALELAAWMVVGGSPDEKGGPAPVIMDDLDEAVPDLRARPEVMFVIEQFDDA